MSPGRESNPRMSVLQTEALPLRHLDVAVTIPLLARNKINLMWKSCAIWYTYIMAKPRKWKTESLKEIVESSYSIREVIVRLGLIPAGGNYEQVKLAIKEQKLDTDHFTGKGWRKNRTFTFSPRKTMQEILVKNSNFQSYKLKKRLYREGLKFPKCELCGWAEQAQDGRIPVELDHINGDRNDNRLRNLRILCPNCHSLQSTHRGRNQKRI